MQILKTGEVPEDLLKNGSGNKPAPASGAEPNAAGPDEVVPDAPVAAPDKGKPRDPPPAE
jgi:hypothetical protein